MKTTRFIAVGGEHFLSRRVLVWLVPGALVTSVLTRDPSSSTDAAVWTAVNVTSLALTWGWVELLRRVITPQSRAHPLGFVVVLVTGASIGAVKGLTTSLFGFLVGALDTLMPVAEWWRTVGVTLQGMFVLPAITLAAQAIANYRNDYHTLLRAYARSAPPGTAEPDHNALVIGGFLTEARDKIGEQHGRAITTVIDRLIDERLRPLTRQLWGTRTAHTDFTVRSLISAALFVNPFPSVIVATGYAVSSFASRAQGLPLTTNLLRTVVSVGVITAVFFIARTLRPAQRTGAVTHFVLTMLLLVGLHVAFVERLTGEPTGMQPVALSITLGIWFPVLTLLGGAVTVAWRGAERTRTLFGELVAHDAKSTSSALQQLRSRELANELHSTVQNRLVAAARRFEEAQFAPHVIRDEQRSLSRLLDDVAKTLTTTTKRPDQKSDLAADVATLAAQWDGFVRLHVTINDTASTVGAEEHTTVMHVLTEAVDNAVRHGHATTITATIRVTPGTVQIVVDDDGFGPVANPPGLGTALYASVSNGNWSLAHHPNGGSTLAVTVSRQSHETR